MGTWSLSLGDPKLEAYFHHDTPPSACLSAGIGLPVSLRLAWGVSRMGAFSSLGAAADHAPSGSSGPLGSARLSLSLSLSHVSIVPASAFLLLPHLGLWSFPPSVLSQL